MVLEKINAFFSRKNEVTCFNDKKLFSSNKIVLSPNKNDKPKLQKTFIDYKISFLAIIGEFCETSTSHGIPSIYRSKGIFLKLLWTFFTLLSSSICFYLIILSFFDFFSYPVQTSIDIINETPTYFPTISICNLNPYKTEDENISSILKQILVSKNQLSGGVPNLITILKNKILQDYISKLPVDNQMKMGKQLKEMLIQCKFNSLPCSENSDFEWFYSPEYGNCYKFNSNSSNLKQIGKSGINSALRLEMFIGNSSSNEDYTDKRGLKILIHNNTQKKVFMSEYGLDVEPGKVTNIQIKRTFFQKLSSPYSDCVDDLSLDTYGKEWIIQILKSINETQYSSNFCQKMYYQRMVEANCNCSDPSYPAINNSLDACCTSRSTICVETQYEKFYTDPNNYTDDSCPKECFSITFSTEISQSMYLTNWYWNELKTYYKVERSPAKKDLYNSISNINTVDEARKNMLLINIYYSDISYTYISESPFWTWASLFSNFGGQLGLFIGMSVLSFIEFIDLFIKLIFELVF